MINNILDLVKNGDPYIIISLSITISVFLLILLVNLIRFIQFRLFNKKVLDIYLSKYKYPKKDIVIDEKSIDYNKNLPCNGDIYKIYFLAYQFGYLNKKSNIISASLLKWIKEDKIKLIENKNQYYLKLNDDVYFNNIVELELYTLIKIASKDNIMKPGEFEKWCNYYYKQVLDWFSLMMRTKTRELKIENKIFNKIEGNSNVGVYATGDPIMDENLEFIYEFTKEVEINLKEILGFKKFVNDFSKLDKDNKLWKDYLIVAEILGIEDTLMSQMTIEFPQIQKMHLDRKFDYIRNMSSRSVSIILKMYSENKYAIKTNKVKTTSLDTTGYRM